MAKNLMIVESPAKAKTIEKFLGKDFVVKSCYGHIRDLEKSKFSVDVEKDFAPKYVIPADKKQVVKELKKLAGEAEEVWLATDEDREGEAISWHLCEVLGIDPLTAKRIVFHEITKSAIQKAVKEPRNIDLNLVNAQQARRVLDRIVGFELSPLLWKKVSLSRSLSAGRVQSVAVRVLAEREEEINNFESVSSYKIAALLDIDKEGKTSTLKAELASKLEDEAVAKAFIDGCVGAVFSVDNVSVKPGKRTPSAPFTTSTLQQEASSKLGFSVSRTMLIAQKLYEEGHITYMRTDSVNLSETAIDAAAKEIESSYGKEYVQSRRFKTKSGSAQEAHEAIRPTFMENHSAGASTDEQKLYKLIWRRTLASQMADAKLEKTTVTIDISTRKEQLQAKGEVILFDGFLKLYTESVNEDEETEESGIIPPLAAGDELSLREMLATERFSKHPPRYTEASLVKKLEELGIGRPSTYAPTISTIQKRGYVEKRDKEGTPREYVQYRLTNKQVEKEVLTENTGAEKAKLFPTDLGILVNSFLTEHFGEILDYGFTASVEQQFDNISIGEIDWPEMIREFYDPFSKTLKETEENAQRVKGERILGTDPASGKPIKALMGRYGPMVMIGEAEDEEKPRFAGLLKDQNLQSITLEEALKLFDLPRKVGSIGEEEVIAAIGRFGPYLKYKGKFYSIPKTYDAISITMMEAEEVIKAKDERDANVNIHNWESEGIQVLNGRYGPYIKVGKLNYKIPKGEDAQSLDLDRVKEIIAETEPTGKGRRFGKKGK
jgi:DNA topoisomerase-1